MSAEKSQTNTDLDTLEIVNKIRQFTIKEIREKLNRWQKKNPEFVKQFNLFFTK
jgi:hypothetical protein